MTAFSVKKTLPSVGLYSFPTSGNTFTRYLIEAITGIFSGSFYSSLCIAMAGKQRFITDNIKIRKNLDVESKYININADDVL